jgi:hypothetical protein
MKGRNVHSLKLRTLFLLLSLLLPLRPLLLCPQLLLFIQMRETKRSLNRTKEGKDHLPLSLSHSSPILLSKASDTEALPPPQQNQNQTENGWHHGDILSFPLTLTLRAVISQELRLPSLLLDQMTPLSIAPPLLFLLLNPRSQYLCKSNINHSLKAIKLLRSPVCRGD